MNQGGIERFLRLPLPSDAEEIGCWARGLAPLGKLAWIRGARAALGVGLRRREDWPVEVRRAVLAVDHWITSPIRDLSVGAAVDAIETSGLLADCDDFRHSVLLAATKLARAAGATGVIDDASQVIALMCRPSVCDMATTMGAVVDSIRALAAPDWLSALLFHLERDIIMLSEAGYGVFQHLAEAPRFDDAALHQIESLPRVLPESVRAVFMKTLEKVAASGEFGIIFPTVGGHGKPADPENVRDVCAIFGLLGPQERERVCSRLGESP